MDLLSKRIVLNVNALWEPLGEKTIKKAIIDMNGGDLGNTPPAKAMDIEYGRNPDGTVNYGELLYINPVDWEEWISLPIRDFDNFIQTKNFKFRVPTVIVSVNHKGMPVKTFKVTRQGVLERDNYTCQYSGKKLPKSELNVDHVVPKDKGGKDTWENQVTCSKDINSKKGNRLNSEVGLKLIKTPKAPPSIRVAALIREARQFDWNHFLIK